jgi:hypothetical protein
MNPMKQISPRTSVLIGIILAAAFSRFLFLNVPNFSPIGAMALFGGAYFSRKWTTYFLPFVALWLSNLVLDNLIYKQWYPEGSWGLSNGSVFLSFALIVLLGQFALRKVTRLNVLETSLISAILFFGITNFAVWQGSSLYPQNIAGLVACYTAGLYPFFVNTLLSQLLFGLLLFGGFEWAKNRYPSMAIA